MIPGSITMMRSSTLRLRLVAAGHRGPTTSFIPRAAFSSAPSVSPAKKEDDVKDNDKPKKQAFVTAQLEPGEWDEHRKDPYFRPKLPRQTRLISAEDFANRPPVAFEGEFSSYRDAMISLSWLDQKTCRQIYSMYTDMMVLSQQHFETTSHEYVVRVIAQKFHLTTWRTAGVIQLQHAEEQLRKNHPELLCDEQAQYAEQTILQNIRDAYKAEAGPRARNNHNNAPPQGVFVEDPTGIHGKGAPDETSTQWSLADDIYDLEQKLAQANVRDEEQARIIIDGHFYKEDVDDQTQLVPTDGPTRGLLRRKENQNQQQQQQEPPPQQPPIPYPETNGKGEKRARWKYVAQVVNTRNKKKWNHTHKHIKGTSASYKNNTVGNTLVEQDGTLRVATVREAQQVAWKPTRTKGNHVIYESAQRAWLDKTLHKQHDVWGRAPLTSASASTAPASTASDNINNNNKKNAKQNQQTPPPEVAASAWEDEEPNEAASPAVSATTSDKEPDEKKAGGGEDDDHETTPPAKEENDSTTTTSSSSSDDDKDAKNEKEENDDKKETK